MSGVGASVVTTLQQIDNKINHSQLKSIIRGSSRAP